MLIFPLDQNASLLVIEPGNIKRMKDGQPLKVGEHIVCFTPDLKSFIKALGIDPFTMPLPGERVEKQVKITPERLDAALKKCQKLPEVER
jgi:hypothetical protein